MAMGNINGTFATAYISASQIQKLCIHQVLTIVYTICHINRNRNQKTRFTHQSVKNKYKYKKSI
jgi:hypothetical protein